MPSSTIASASGSRATLPTKLVPRSSIRTLSALVGQFGGGLDRRANDRRIARASAQMSAQQIANALLIRSLVLAQEAVERHQDAGGAEAALQRVMALERRLQDAEAAGRRREAFHGPDLAAVNLHGKREAGACRLAVDEDGAGAAHPVFAADMRAGRADLMAQEIGQQQPRLRLARAWAAVQREADRMPPAGLQSAHCSTSCTRSRPIMRT